MAHNNLLFADGEAASTLLNETEQYPDMQSSYSHAPDDDEESGNESDDETTGSDEPAIDDDVVHSPVVTRPGGKPKSR